MIFVSSDAVAVFQSLKLSDSIGSNVCHERGERLLQKALLQENVHVLLSFIFCFTVPHFVDVSCLHLRSKEESQVALLQMCGVIRSRLRAMQMKAFFKWQAAVSYAASVLTAVGF